MGFEDSTIKQGERQVKKAWIGVVGVVIAALIGGGIEIYKMLIGIAALS